MCFNFIPLCRLLVILSNGLIDKLCQYYINDYSCNTTLSHNAKTNLLEASEPKTDPLHSLYLSSQSLTMAESLFCDTFQARLCSHRGHYVLHVCFSHILLQSLLGNISLWKQLLQMQNFVRETETKEQTVNKVPQTDKNFSHILQVSPIYCSNI